MISYRIDKKIADTDPQEKGFTDVLVSEVLLPSQFFTCVGMETPNIFLRPTAISAHQ